MKQVEQEHRYPKPITSRSTFVDASILRKAARYVRFASAASSLSDRKAIINYIGGLEPVDVILIPKSSFSEPPGVFIATDLETNDVVVAIGGSSNAADALEGVANTKEPYLG